MQKYLVNHANLWDLSMAQYPFSSRLEMLVDFYDDLYFSECPFRAEDIDSLFEHLAKYKISTVAWYYLADDRGGWINRFEPSPDEPTRSRFQVYRECNVMQRAAAAAHAHGMRFIVGFKPYETGFFALDIQSAKEQGIQTYLQAGRMITGVDPFVVQHPELRMRLRPSLRNRDPLVPIGRIELWKMDDAPTRIKKENIEFLSSNNNFGYKPMNVEFEFNEDIRVNPQEETDLTGAVVIPAGKPVRVLVLDNLNFSARYWALRCKGLNGDGDFKGLGTRLMRVYDRNGNLVDGCFAGKRTICDSEHNDLTRSPYFDFGYGRYPQTLDAPGEYIAFMADRPDYVTGSLCETEPAVQVFWLKCIGKILEAGVDGIEFRIENHGHMTDHIFDYGFNDAVLKLAGENATDEQIAKIRGDAYTDFLRKAVAMIRAAGKISRLNISIDRISDPVPEDRYLAWPMNVEYQWKQWLKEGLADEAVYRVFYRFLRPKALKHPLTDEITSECHNHGIPIVFSHYFRGDEPWSWSECERILKDNRFDGLCLYENSSMMKLNKNHEWEWFADNEKIVRKLETLL